MSKAEVDVQSRAGVSNKNSIRTVAVVLGLSVGMIVVGFEAWDIVETLNFDAVSSPDGGAGYGNPGPTNSGARSRRVSPGYSTGPDDKNYLRLPGVPDYPGRPR